MFLEQLIDPARVFVLPHGIYCNNQICSYDIVTKSNEFLISVFRRSLVRLKFLSKVTRIPGVVVRTTCDDPIRDAHSSYIQQGVCPCSGNCI